MSLPTTSLEARFCERVGQGEVNGFTQRVKTSRPCPGLAVIMKCPVRAGWAISHALSINGPRKQSSQLVGLPVPVFKVALHEWVWLELCMCM